MGLVEWARRSVPIMEHPVFGPLRASLRDHSGPWLWDALELLHTNRGDVDLGFEAGAAGPGPSHEAQLDEVIAQLDALTAAAAPLIDRKFGGWLERSLGDDPWRELEWQGALLTGRSGDFRLHYSCQSWPDAMVAVSFEEFRPALVEIDD